jgi:hypothetical protein
LHFDADVGVRANQITDADVGAAAASMAKRCG